MGPVEINGLPAHALLVHAVVVLLPLTCLLLVVGAVRPAWLRRTGPALPVLAVVSLALVPVTTHAGEWLRARVPADPLAERHAELGDSLLPWAVAVCAVAVLLWWTYGRPAPSPNGSTGRVPAALLSAPVRIAVVVIALVVATGCCVQVYRIGDSGARAVWHDSFSTTPR